MREGEMREGGDERGKMQEKERKNLREMAREGGGRQRERDRERERERERERWHGEGGGSVREREREIENKARKIVNKKL